MKTGILALIMMLSLGVSGAYDFGSKVVAGDDDVSLYLDDFATAGAPIICERDLTGTPAAFSPGDMLYLDGDQNAIISLNDVRLMPFQNFPAGSQVAAGDVDIGNAYVVGFGYRIKWANIMGIAGQYDLGDAVYVDTTNTAVVSNGDIRLTAINGLAAGTLVEDFHPDAGLGAIAASLIGATPGAVYTTPCTNGPLAQLRFYNANGNFIPGTATPVYDTGDGIYLDISGMRGLPLPASIRYGTNVPNNVRLTA